MSKLISFFTRWQSVIAVVAITMVILSFRGSYWQARYEKEKNSHALTRIELSKAIEKIQYWELASEVARHDASVQANTAQACLDREAVSQQASREREVLASKATTRPLTDKEKNEVVNDDVRQEYTARFNRPL